MYKAFLPPPSSLCPSLHPVQRGQRRAQLDAAAEENHGTIGVALGLEQLGFAEQAICLNVIGCRADGIHSLLVSERSSVPLI